MKIIVMREYQTNPIQSSNNRRTSYISWQPQMHSFSNLLALCNKLSSNYAIFFKRKAKSWHVHYHKQEDLTEIFALNGCMNASIFSKNNADQPYLVVPLASLSWRCVLIRMDFILHGLDGTRDSWRDMKRGTVNGWSVQLVGHSSGC